MIDLLAKFYKAYLDWVDTGENPHNFASDKGLCNNIYIYGESFGLCDSDMLDVDIYQGTLFVKAGLCEVFPFDGDRYNYQDTIDKRTNPDRIQWVRDFLNE